MMWEGSLLVDTALPFGLCSAPKIFTALADAAEWMVRQQGVEFIIHYLDDFLVMAADEHQGSHALRLLLETFEHLGLPIAWDKLEGPSPCLTFLGFELDSTRGEIRLPWQKLGDIRSKVHRWLDRKACTKRELESLVGRLSHASRVVKPGKTFMRHLFEALTGTRQAHHHVRLSSSIRSDIRWWHTFMAEWNGVSMIPHLWTPSLEFWTDASGSFGCGAVCPALSRWIQLQWIRGMEEMRVAEGDSITWMELLPIVLAGMVWGQAWRGQRIIL